jgi:hypothetical protein
MNPRVSHQKTAAMTMMEVLVVIVVLVVLAAILLPAFNGPHSVSHRPDPCYWNQRQITLAFYVWADDHNGKYPMQVSETNWGVRELALKGDVAGIFRAMPNLLDTPKYLYCPFDKKGKAAADFGSGFSRANVNYFIGIDAERKSPAKMILAGDDNLLVNGKSIPYGLLSLSTNASVAWTKDRHDGNGFVALTDGSVQRIDGVTLQWALQTTGFATNRLGIP